MATNFSVKIGEIGPSTFMRRPAWHSKMDRNIAILILECYL